jgi:hypothetical protein
VTEFVDNEGKVHTATMQDLWQKQLQQGPEVKEEDLKKLELLNKGFGGDPNAMNELVASYMPGLTVAPTDPPAQTGDPATVARLTEVTDRLQQVERQLQQAQSVTGQVTTMQEVAQLKSAIASQKDKVPYLAHHPDGAVMVQQMLANARAMAEHNKTPLNQNQMISVLAATMRQANASLEATAKLYSQFTPEQLAAATQQQPAPQVIDDQTPEPGRVASQWSQQVQAAQQQAAAAAPAAQQTIPSQPPTMAPTSPSITPGTAPGAEGPQTREQVMARMRRRVAERSAE